MSLRKFALWPLATIVLIFVLSFALDLFTVMIYREDARTQTFIGGFYVAGMAADPAALASGKTDSTSLYKDDDIHKEFKNYAIASFSRLATGPIQVENGKIEVPVGEMFINKVVAKSQIHTAGSEKGVIITIEYHVDPKINTFLPRGVDAKPYVASITRKFRILGQ